MLSFMFTHENQEKAITLLCCFMFLIYKKIIFHTNKCKMLKQNAFPFFTYQCALGYQPPLKHTPPLFRQAPRPP